MRLKIQKLFSFIRILYNKSIKKIFHWDFVSKRKSNSVRAGFDEEDDIFSLSRFQLENLINKNIHFDFFQLENFSFDFGKKTEILLQQVKKKTEKELLSDLSDQDLQKPMVLICNKGLISKKTAEQLREKGFINVYFIKEGLQGLLKEAGFS